MAAVAYPLQEQQQQHSQPRSHENGSLMNLFESCATGFFGPCEDTCQQASRTVFWEPTPILNKADNNRIQTLDFEKLHDQFLESMLHEAACMGDEEAEETSQYTAESSHHHLLRQHSSLSSEEAAGDSPRKRRRPLRLTRRRTPPRLRKVSPLSDHHSSASTEHSKSSSTSVTISLSDLSKATLPKPETYLHELVRMQKDKGKGEPVGSNLCAKGRDACLGKLREKMQLLTEVATEKATGATMKIRKARAAERVDNFVETRSLINLRMGFLSMTYGILLRWDTTKTGTITLVVLRKMCHESFYPNESKVPASVSTARSALSNNSNNKSLLRSSSTAEFASLEPPFCIQPPTKYPQATLTVSFVAASGLSKKSNWTVQLAVDDSVENIPLQWDTSKRVLSPRTACALRHLTGERIRWGQQSTIQVKLFENKIRRRIPRRMATHMMVPLANLQPQRAPARPSRITVPCTHDSDACVILDVAWQSNYALWAAREVLARQQQQSLPPKVIVTPTARAAEEEAELENQDPWDWICHVC